MKVRPAVVIASTTYLSERADVLVGILTTRVPKPPAASNYDLQDWRVAGLRAESNFRAYVLTVHRSELSIGHLSDRDWNNVKARVSSAFANYTQLSKIGCLAHSTIDPATLHGPELPANFRVVRNSPKPWLSTS